MACARPDLICCSHELQISVPVSAACMTTLVHIASQNCRIGGTLSMTAIYMQVGFHLLLAATNAEGRKDVPGDDIRSWVRNAGKMHYRAGQPRVHAR